MFNKITVLLLLGLSIQSAAQETSSSSTGFRNLPLVVTLNFNAISTPFNKIKNNFRNVGLRVGTEVSWNKKQNLYQSFNIGFYRNRLNGDGLYMNSEFIYRPEIYNGMRLEFKLGPGLADLFLPTHSYKPDGKGSWQKASNPGKMNFQVHTSIGIYYQDFTVNNLKVASFLQYEIVGVTNYNKSVPLLPMSFIHAGSRIKF